MDMQSLDFSNPEIKRHSYETYRILRETQPVIRVALPNKPPFWLVTRFKDVVAIFKDERFVKDYRNALTPEEIAQIPQNVQAVDFGNQSLLFADGADHTRLRALVSKAFTPRRIEELRPRIQQITDELLDELEQSPSFDLIDKYASVIPIMVISEMLGIPPADRPQFREWTTALFTGANLFVLSPELEPVMHAFGAYIFNMVETRRKAPSDDLVSALIQVREQGDALNEKELMGMIFLLMIAGFETTMNLIGNAVVALLTHPEQLALLQNNPDLIKGAVEEFLRYDGSVENATFRFASTDIEFQGQHIPRGEQIMLVLGSANRDPEQFENPDDLNIIRQIKQHVGFGHGIHICLGAPLARLEAQIAIASLFKRMPTLALTVPVEELRYHPSIVSRGLESIPVKH